MPPRAKPGAFGAAKRRQIRGYFGIGFSLCPGFGTGHRGVKARRERCPLALPSPPVPPLRIPAFHQRGRAQAPPSTFLPPAPCPGYTLFF